MWKVIVLLLLLAFTFCLVYEIHSNYKYPFHTEEWQHLARGIQIIENKRILLKNPYYNTEEMNLEIGFHIFLAEFFY